MALARLNAALLNTALLDTALLAALLAHGVPPYCRSITALVQTLLLWDYQALPNPQCPTLRPYLQPHFLLEMALLAALLFGRAGPTEQPYSQHVISPTCCDLTLLPRPYYRPTVW